MTWASGSVRPAGDSGLLIEPKLPPARLAAAVMRARLPGVIDAIPAARTVLVIVSPGTWQLAELAAVIADLTPPEPDQADDTVIEIPVVYDGADLADVAELTGLTVGDVIARHQRADYRVGWLGFAPGFGYLTGLDHVLSGVPRLATPRIVVPAGSVAIAGGYTAVYPAASPGGWRLLGRTALAIWDPQRDPPSLLRPGKRIRFVAVGESEIGEPRPATRPAAATSSATPTSARYLQVIRPGPLATVQDLGRPGLGSLGVPPSGAADAASLIAANTLLGNAAGEAVIELTLGRATLRCAGGLRLAVTGAAARVTWTAAHGQLAHEVPFGTAFDLPDGGELQVGPPAAGMRSYVAVAGGLQVPQVLGSRSSDLLSGLGGGPLRPGNILPVGDCPAADPTRAGGPPAALIPARGTTARLGVIAGPRVDWFGANAMDVLCGSPYTVSTASNRTGLRLDGPALPRAGSAELPSEGMVTGSIQVPHDGKPILLLTDHPTVGGYPVIAVLTSADIGLAGQLRPGEQVLFKIRGD